MKPTRRGDVALGAAIAVAVVVVDSAGAAAWQHGATG